MRFKFYARQTSVHSPVIFFRPRKRPPKVRDVIENFQNEPNFFQVLACYSLFLNDYVSNY